MKRRYGIALSGIVLLMIGLSINSAVMMYVGAGALGLIAFAGFMRN